MNVSCAIYFPGGISKIHRIPLGKLDFYSLERSKCFKRHPSRHRDPSSNHETREATTPISGVAPKKQLVSKKDPQYFDRQERLRICCETRHEESHVALHRYRHDELQAFFFFFRGEGGQMYSWKLLDWKGDVVRYPKQSALFQPLVELVQLMFFFFWVRDSQA